MPRPPKKSTAALAEAQKTGELRAIRKAKKKESVWDKIQPYLVQMAHNVDPLELAAILGATLVVHEVIFKLAEFTDKVKGLLETSGEKVFVFLKPILDLAHIPYIDPTQTDLPSVKLDRGQTGDILLWLVAFAVAYWSIKHGDDLLATAKSFVGTAITAA